MASGHSGRLLLGRRVVIPGDYTTNAHRAGRRGRQHRPRPGAVLRSALAEGRQKRALRRKPARDGPPAVAQPAFEPRALLRSRHHQRQLGRLGVVRPFRRLAGLHHAHLRDPRARSHGGRPDQRHRRLGRTLGRRRDAHPARLFPARRALAQGARLDRAVVERVGRGRPRADGRQGAGRRSRLHQSHRRCRRARDHRPRPGPHRGGGRLFELRRARPPRPQPLRQGDRGMAGSQQDAPRGQGRQGDRGAVRRPGASAATRGGCASHLAADAEQRQRANGWDGGDSPHPRADFTQPPQPAASGLWRRQC